MTASLDGQGEDPNVQFYAPTLPPWLTFDGRNTIHGTPGTADIGEHRVALIAVRGFSFQSQSFTISVTPPNQPPTLPDPPPTLTMQEDVPLKLTATMLSAVDEQPDLLLVELQPPPSGARYRIEGADVIVPELNYHGPLDVPVRVRDSRAYSNTVTARINVMPVNDPPVISAIPTLAAGAGEEIVIELRDYVSDPEGDPLTFDAVEPAGDFSLDPATGRFMMTAPALADPVDRDIHFTVSDGSASSSGMFTLELLGVGRADLAAAVDVNPDPARIDEAATVTLTVTHVGGLDAGQFELETQLFADVPFSVDPPSDPACHAAPDGEVTLIQCLWNGLASGTALSVDVPVRASAAGEVVATTSVRSLPGSPIDEHAANDRAALAWLVAGDLGEGPLKAT